MAANSVISAAKKAIRKDIKLKLRSLTDSEKIRQSSIVTQKLLKCSAYQDSARISIFLSMHDEIRTEGILNHIFSSGKKCYMPHYVGENMEMVRLHSMDDYNSLPETSWKIKQPQDDEVRENALETGGLDLVLIPGLAFSLEGGRLGRGKGYYDKYLSRLIERTKKRPHLIALAFKESILNEVPVTSDDFIIDSVLYEDNS